MSESPDSLALFPTGIWPGNFHIIYRLRTKDGTQKPKGTWYVFENQTQGGGGRRDLGNGDNISPSNQNSINLFDDTLGGGGLNTTQYFTISDDPGYCSGHKYPVMIRYHNEKDFLRQHIYQPSAADPVLINGYTQIPKWPNISGEF